MNCPRSAFTPCEFNGLVYLCDGNSTTVETFDCMRRIFALLSLQLDPGFDRWSCATVVRNGKLTLVTREKLSVVCPKAQRVEKTVAHREYHAWSHSQPVLVGNTLLLVDYYEEVCRAVDVDSGTLLWERGPLKVASAL